MLRNKLWNDFAFFIPKTNTSKRYVNWSRVKWQFLQTSISGWKETWLKQKNCQLKWWKGLYISFKKAICIWLVWKVFVIPSQVYQKFGAKIKEMRWLKKKNIWLTTKDTKASEQKTTWRKQVHFFSHSWYGGYISFKGPKQDGNHHFNNQCTCVHQNPG